jgi:hypothetical protein
LAKPWKTTHPIKTDLLFARDYEVDEESRRPHSDAKEQVRWEKIRRGAHSDVIEQIQMKK